MKLNKILNMLIIPGIVLLPGFFVNKPIYAKQPALTQAKVASCFGKAGVDYPDESKMAQIFWYCLNKQANTSAFIYMEDLNACLPNYNARYVPVITNCLNQHIKNVEQSW